MGSRSMRSVTLVAPRVSHRSSTLVGALQRTWSGGPFSATISGPSSAETGTEGGPVVVVALGVVVVATAVVVAPEVVEVSERGRPGALLLHAPNPATPAIVAIETTRGRRTQRS